MKRILEAFVDGMPVHSVELLGPLAPQAHQLMHSISIRGPPLLSWLNPAKLGMTLGDQRGAINIGSVMMLGIAMVFLAVGFIMLPISTDATTDIMDWTCTANASINDETFTGFTSVVGITPLLILVGFLTAAVVTGMMGIKIMKGASVSANPGSLMLLGLSIVFISIGLIIEPVVLDALCDVLTGDGSGISSDFTGYESIVLISPLLVHIAFLAAAVLSGYFGIRRLSSSMT